MAIIKCGRCEWEGPPEKCKASMNPYHDMYCPECGTSNLDTSELNAEWRLQGRKYGYGDGNVLNTGS